jgi:hypothetical protein
LGVKILYPKRSGDFAQWLARHASRTPEVWLVFQKRTSGKQTATYLAAVAVRLEVNPTEAFTRSL